MWVDILEIFFWNDSPFVSLTKWRIIFHYFSYVCIYVWIYIFMSRNMMKHWFYLRYLHVSNSALFVAKYSCTLLLHRCSLHAFYWLLSKMSITIVITPMRFTYDQRASGLNIHSVGVLNCNLKSCLCGVWGRGFTISPCMLVHFLHLF